MSISKRLLGALWALVLALTLLPSGAVTAEAASPVVYDGNKMATFARSADQVMARYNKVVGLSNGYVDGSSGTYYTVPASTVSPYNKGTLKASTLEAMAEMTNFYRYLAGVESAQVNTVSDASLQAQALDRNFEFNHDISQSSKPADMPQTTWDEGFACKHSILAGGSTPRSAIINWINEGYSLSNGTWDTLGHRSAVLSPATKAIDYGYSGQIAVGNSFIDGNGVGNYDFTQVSDDNGDGVQDERDESYRHNCYSQKGYWGFKEAFSAFPAPGPMPNWLIMPGYSAWNVVLNLKDLRVVDADKVAVTVTNLTTKTSYTCTKANGKAQVYTGSIDFVQPNAPETDWRSRYKDAYRVDITGLKEIPSRKDAKLTYTVNFFAQPPAAPASVTAKATGGDTVRVTWSAVQDADFYQVWRMDKKDAAPGVCIGVYDANTTSCTSRKLQFGAAYYYRVRAYKKVGDKKVYGPYGPTASASTAKLPGPEQMTASAAGCDAVRLTWSKVSGADFYQVWRMDKQGAAPGACIGVYDANTTSCTSRKLKPGGTYYYRVRPYKKVGDKRIYGEYGPTVSAATTGLPGPASMGARTMGRDTIQLSWSAVQGADFYQVWRMDSREATPGVCIGVYDANTTSSYSRKLDPGSAYYYRVRAYKKVGSQRFYGSYGPTIGASTWS